ncbi:MAG: hypothetical protein R3D69_11285 [Xanthobacteraceae bacterium]
MDARTNIKSRLPGRHVTAGQARAPMPAIAHEGGVGSDLPEAAEVFKKTPYIADLKPAGRDVAKDMFEDDGKPQAERFGSGVVWTYARQVGSAPNGAVTHPGGTNEKQCYADI